MCNAKLLAGVYRTSLIHARKLDGGLHICDLAKQVWQRAFTDSHKQARPRCEEAFSDNRRVELSRPVKIWVPWCISHCLFLLVHTRPDSSALGAGVSFSLHLVLPVIS